MIDSVFRTSGNYYPQVFLEECKYVVKERKIHDYIIDNIETLSDDSDREDSNEENYGKKNLTKKIIFRMWIKK